MLRCLHYTVSQLSGNLPTNAGGFVGAIDSDSSVQNSFWCTDCTAATNDSSGAYQKTFAQMTQKVTYEAWGWDMIESTDTDSNSTWIISDGNSSPELCHNDLLQPNNILLGVSKRISMLTTI